MSRLDLLDADRLSAPGGEPVLIVSAADWRRPDLPIQAVVIGVDREAALPKTAIDDFDLLLTSAPDAPRPWVSIKPGKMDTEVGRLAGAVQANPQAATIAASTLRMASRLPCGGLTSFYAEDQGIILGF